MQSPKCKMTARLRGTSANFSFFTLQLAVCILLFGGCGRSEPVTPVASAAATASIGSRWAAFGRVPSNAALTASIGSRSPAALSSVTGGRIVVNRSSGGTGGRWPGEPGSGGALPPLASPAGHFDPPPVAGPLGTSVADRSWCSPLFTGRAGTVARRPRSAGALGRASRAEHIRLDQVIPAAGPAYLHHVNREFLVTGCHQNQLFGGSCRARYRAQLIAEHPRHQRELLLPADRAHHRTGLPVKLRGAQQIRVCVTHLGYAGAPQVHLGQQ